MAGSVSLFKGTPKAQVPIKTDRLILVQGTALMASVMPTSPLKFASQGVLTGELDIDTAILLEEIIRRESGGNPTAKNPKSTAYGYCQFINSTWNYVQKKWDIKLDRYNPDDQLYACIRLLEEEGIIHWAESGPY